MAPAPWDAAPSNGATFVLITGANSGIGFGIGQRLIDEYLTTRSLTSHLVLIPTTRSAKKSQETINALRQHAKEFATASTALQSRAGPAYDPRQATRRVHIISVQLDLCDLATVRRAAQQLVSSTISSPSSDPDFEPLVDVRIPRLDAVIFNAGIGGWTGLDWPKVAHNILTKGLVQATTWPTFKAATAGHLVNPLPKSSSSTSQPPKQLGEVFCANVFGHYLFAHALTPLLSRGGSPSTPSSIPPGRIIWESSVEPVWENLSLDDLQAIKTNAAYESTKRLTDVLALTATLPATQPFVSSYLSPASTKKDVKPPKLYVVHPGVVQTTLFPLNAFMFFWYRVVLYIARWLGSPWHPITSYNGACAPVWLALQQQEALDAASAERVKWGSATDRAGQCLVKMTEVEGWGWDGTLQDPTAAAADKGADAVGVLRKHIGRKSGAVDLTKERRVEFEALGAECWKRMEKLRAEWEAKLDA